MNKYFLHINEPCTEDLDKMTPTEQGKFCSSCQKTVFDFSTATDIEIVNHIERMKGEDFCGNFEKNQLDRWVSTSNLKTSNKKLYQLLLSLFLTIGSQHAFAQEPVKKEQIENQNNQDSLSNKDKLKSSLKNDECEPNKKGLPLNSDKNEPRIMLRGAISCISNNSPLILLDGIPIKDSILNKLDSEKIKSITVLIPAEASAIYGSDAHNGAIIITSKKRAIQKSNKKAEKSNK